MLGNVFMHGQAYFELFLVGKRKKKIKLIFFFSLFLLARRVLKLAWDQCFYNNVSAIILL